MAYLRSWSADATPLVTTRPVCIPRMSGRTLKRQARGIVGRDGSPNLQKRKSGRSRVLRRQATPVDGSTKLKEGEPTNFTRDLATLCAVRELIFPNRALVTYQYPLLLLCGFT
jgi:hypothetical protein